MSSAQELTAEFLRVSRREFRTDLEKIEKAMAKMTPDQVWLRGHENANAVGNLILHLAGNVRQWIVSGVGGAPDERDRDAEFAQREAMPVEELLSRLRDAVEEADRTLERIGDDAGLDLLEKRRIQVFDVTLMHAVYHCVEHFSGHTGQIIWAAKNVSGEGMCFYDYLKDPGKVDSGLQP